MLLRRLTPRTAHVAHQSQSSFAACRRDVGHGIRGPIDSDGRRGASALHRPALPRRHRRCSAFRHARKPDGASAVATGRLAGLSLHRRAAIWGNDGAAVWPAHHQRHQFGLSHRTLCRDGSAVRRRIVSRMAAPNCLAIGFCRFSRDLDVVRRCGWRADGWRLAHRALRCGLGASGHHDCTPCGTHGTPCDPRGYPVCRLRDLRPRSD